MNFHQAIAHVMNGLSRVTRPSWTDMDAPYPLLGYLVNVHHLVREGGLWSPEDESRIPRNLVLKIEGGLLFGRSPYEPEPEDLVAEDWEIFLPPDDFAGSDWELREILYPEDLWPGEEDGD